MRVIHFITRTTALLFISSAVVYATPVPLGYANFQASGTITPQTCDVTVASKNKTITIGDFAANSFTTVGSVTPAKDLVIDLENCAQTSTGSTITFSGTQDETDPALLKLSDTKGQGNMATGIAVEILDAVSGTPIKLNQPSAGISLVTGANTLKYQLRYKSTASTVTAGNATAIMYFDMNYQ
ncbi:fimbrial protein [Lelliottia sp. V89_10]|uniref:fimbrial protein n=1 Tax=Lelliottia wanjuensis TaxID=3050585 RepID=UPI00249F6AC6|nr:MULTISPECIES: fimbrial protein [unclassified Lelliottia]MDI3362780.1 fimbrial protein [Lelliottia sp. V89_13]MDK9547663.1 fimbrial protein [Lelliottia sp. V89_5]MDK9598041.1 fimbrial protein [Lelliottia sp. V89_10]